MILNDHRPAKYEVLVFSRFSAFKSELRQMAEIGVVSYPSKITGKLPLSYP